MQRLLEIGIDYTLKDKAGKTAEEYGDDAKAIISVTPPLTLSPH
jgi:hypothetical protein